MGILAADCVRKVENELAPIDKVTISDANECMTMILQSSLDMHMRSTLLGLINTKVAKKNTQTLHLGSHRFLLFPTKLSLFTPGQVNMSLAFPRTTCGVCIVRYMQLVGKRSYVPICMLFFAVAQWSQTPVLAHGSGSTFQSIDTGMIFAWQAPGTVHTDFLR